MSQQRIAACFAAARAEGRAALVVYLTVGDPSVDDTLACARAALQGGADMLELGVPFSDPTADGPVISAAAYRAIARGGSLRATLELARRLRAESDAPLILFSYYNPIVQWGEGRLASDASVAGIDGLLLVDVPPEEASLLRARAHDEGLAVIPLVAPTTGAEREPTVLAGASGFVYLVSVTGVTGHGAAPLVEAGRAAVALEARSGLPVAVGFGVTDRSKAEVVARQGAAGVVVGTAVVRAAAEPGTTSERAERVRALVADIRAGLARA